MALTDAAINALPEIDIIFAPGKAANAGGVALSAMEMSQNASFISEGFTALDERL